MSKPEAMYGLLLLLLLAGCPKRSSPGPDAAAALPVSAKVDAAAISADSDEARALREQLVRGLREHVKDEQVMSAMARVPRHLFVPGVSIAQAYRDSPAPIGYGQTISQPTVVAIMTEALDLTGRERVLEIGTGSGYQASILSLLAAEVFTIEIVPELAAEAGERLTRFGYANVEVRTGDGYLGWPERAPFERILVTAAPEVVPRSLFDQLAEGGVLVAPVGPRSWSQRLMRYRKKGGEISAEDLGAVRFVPMVPGDANEPG